MSMQGISLVPSIDQNQGIPFIILYQAQMDVDNIGALETLKDARPENLRR